MIDKNILFVSSTDTTVGFLSQNPHRLDQAKGRRNGKKYITALPSLHELKKLARSPARHRRMIRRALRRTFVMPDNQAYRIVRDPSHLMLLLRLGHAFSTSANQSGKTYDERYAVSMGDIIIEPLRELHPPSSIYRLGKRKMRKIR
jgi:tRNA A37 threonylcarbamoyladenosine synthetase subunit TsaC/SUA5/YrdC